MSHHQQPGYGIPIPFSQSSGGNLSGSGQPQQNAAYTGLHLQPPPQYPGGIPHQHQYQAGPSSSRKPRGRPPGSKNKPKPPAFFPQELESSVPVRPIVLEVGTGVDVVESAVQLARRRNAGFSILNASGVINNVTLFPPMNHTAPFTLHGPFAILGFAGSYVSPTALGGGFAPAANLPPFIPNLPPSAINSTFGICLSGVNGHIFGGIVGGKVMAARHGVTLVGLLFRNPEFHRIGVINEAEIEEDIDNPGGGGHGDGGGANGSGGGDAGASGSGTMPLYGSVSMGFGVPSVDLNVMQWSQGYPSIVPPTY